jgi:cytochrome c oxidase assembly factor CtaG
VSVHDPGLGQLLGSWQLDPGPVAALGAAALLYAAGVRRAPRGWPVVRLAAFLGGLATLAVALLSGLDTYSERLLTVHMAQHLLLMLLAPALLLSGAPVRLALAAGPPWCRRAVSWLLQLPALRMLAKPALGFAALAAVTLATHLTGIYETALRDPRVHALEHAAFFWAGVLFLAPLAGSDPLPRRPGPLSRFAWLMAGTVAMAVPGALLAFGTTVRYRFYLPEARSLRISALTDQHLAGAVMWIGGGLAMFALALGVVMRALLAEERRQRRREAHALAPRPPSVSGAPASGGTARR